MRAYADRLCALALFVGVALTCRWYGGSAAGDDTFIYLRYVGNALAGDGYTFNVGERSFGVTSPLWTWSMTLVAAAFGNALEVYRLASTLLLATAAVAVYALARRHRASPAHAALLALVVALEPHTLRWSSSGMENGLAALLVVLLAVSQAGPADAPDTPRSARKGAMLGACAGLLPFVRPELSMLGGLVLLSRGNRRAWLGAAAVAACGLALSWLAFGAVVPQTAAAKAIALEQYEPSYALSQTAKIALSGGAASIALIGVLALRERRRPSAFGLAALSSVALFGIYLSVVNQLVSTRYASSLSFPLVLAGALAALHAPPALRRLAALGLAAQLALSLAVLAYVFPLTRLADTADIERFASRVRAATRPDARIALTEVGAFGARSERYVIDLVGLVDRASLEWLRAHGKPRTQLELEALLVARRADYYVDPYAGAAPLACQRLRCEPVLEVPVRRAIHRTGGQLDERWRLYRLQPR